MMVSSPGVGVSGVLEDGCGRGGLGSGSSHAGGQGGGGLGACGWCRLSRGLRRCGSFRGCSGVGGGLDAHLAALELGVLHERRPDRAQERIALGVCVADDLLAQLLRQGGAVLLGLLEVGFGEADLVEVRHQGGAVGCLGGLAVHVPADGCCDLHGAEAPPCGEKALRTAFSMPRSSESSNPTAASFGCHAYAEMLWRRTAHCGQCRGTFYVPGCHSPQETISPGLTSPEVFAPRV